MLQVTVLRGENASAKSLHSVVQTLESDKVKLELKVKNLELQLKENKRQLSSSSGKRMPSSILGHPKMCAFSRGLFPVEVSPAFPLLNQTRAWHGVFSYEAVHDGRHHTVQGNKEEWRILHP